MPPRTLKAGIQWNPEKGDKVLLMVMELSIDNLMVGKGDGVVNSQDGRNFDLSDAVAISGFLNDTENKPLPKEDGLVINYDDQKITIKKNGDIEIGGDSVKKLVNEEFKSVFEGHKHAYIDTIATTATPTFTTAPSKDLLPLVPAVLIDGITSNQLTSKTKAE